MFNAIFMGKSFDINRNALGGSAPAARASPGCKSAVLPVCNRGKIFCSGNTEVSQCAMSPHWGRGWRKGVIITMKRGIPQSNAMQMLCQNNTLPANRKWRTVACFPHPIHDSFTTKESGPAPILSGMAGNLCRILISGDFL